MKRPDGRAEFEGLYRLHRAEIIRYLIRQGADPDDVEDIAQTAFLHAYGAYTAGRRPVEPRPWLFAVARNTHRRRFRPLAARVRQVAIDPELPEAEHDPLLARELAAALAELPENQRAALVQRELQGLDYEEIAERLDVTVGAVQMLLFRARTALRRRRFGVALLAPSRQLARAADAAWSWLQRLGPAEGAAGALAVAVAGVAAVSQAPAAPAAASRGSEQPHLVLPAPVWTARAPLVGAQPPARTSERALPTRPAPPAAPATQAATLAPAAVPPAEPARATVPAPPPKTSPPQQTAPAAPPTPATTAVGTTTVPLEVAVPVPLLDAPAAPPGTAPSVTVPTSAPPLPVPDVAPPPSLPIPTVSTPTVPQSPLP